VSAARPVADPDVFWHVRTGQLILDEGIPRVEPWAFTAIGREWVPTAWLSDLAMALAHAGIGWRGLILFKLVLTAILLTGLARLLLDSGPARLAVPILVLATFSLGPFLTERPQLVSLCLTVALVHVCRGLLLDGQISWWVVGVGYLWANLHGMWVLMPTALCLVALGIAMDHRPGWRAPAARSLLIAALTIISSALTPVGPRLPLAPFAVHRAASDVSEWLPTNLLDPFSMFFLAMFLVWVASAALSSVPAPPSEVLWMLGILVFSVAAARNVAPATILGAPFVVSALTRAYQPRLARIAPAPRVPTWIPVSLVAVACVSATALTAVRPPLVEGLPSRVVAELRDRQVTMRVLNSYSIGGYLTGMGAPQISVAIDGRTENYDPEYVHRYFDATTRMVGWRELVGALDPDVAVIGRRSQLSYELQRLGWRPTMTDGDYVLLDRPGGSRGH
jgi:hypothetical protein